MIGGEKTSPRESLSSGYVNREHAFAVVNEEIVNEINVIALAAIFGGASNTNELFGQGDKY